MCIIWKPLSFLWTVILYLPRRGYKEKQDVCVIERWRNYEDGNWKYSFFCTLSIYSFFTHIDRPIKLYNKDAENGFEFTIKNSLGRLLSFTVLDFERSEEYIGFTVVFFCLYVIFIRFRWKDLLGSLISNVIFGSKSDVVDIHKR